MACFRESERVIFENDNNKMKNEQCAQDAKEEERGEENHLNFG